MFNKIFDDINFEDIEGLIDQGVTESQGLEYKQEMWGLSDGDKKEMLKDIASMSNKYGGYIIIGIKEDGKGKAVNILSVKNADRDRDRIASIVFSSIQPRLSLKMKVLSKNDVNILLINIPSSFRKPHIITFQGLNQFWIRHDRQKMPMHINEIQGAFINITRLNKDIDVFFEARKLEIMNEIQGPPVKSVMVIGVYPALAEKEMIDVHDENIRLNLKTSVTDMGTRVNWNFRATNARPSYNGLVIDSDFRKIELYRSGYMEGQINISDIIYKYGNNGDSVINSHAIVGYIYNFLKKSKQIYDYLGYDGQIIVYCDFLNIKGLYLLDDRSSTNVANVNQASISHVSINQVKWEKRNKAHLEIKPLIFDEFNEVRIAKEVCDRIWQSFGFEHEPFFNGSSFDFS